MLCTTTTMHEKEMGRITRRCNAVRQKKRHPKLSMPDPASGLAGADKSKSMGHGPRECWPTPLAGRHDGSHGPRGRRQRVVASGLT